MTETPAETMRRAAAEMRTEGGWVWAAADLLEDRAVYYDCLTANCGDAEAAAFIAGEWGQSVVVVSAVAVARAYLGEKVPDDRP